MATFTEMETDEKQRARGNFGYNNFGSSTTVLDNQLDFTTSIPSYNSPSSYSPSVSTYEGSSTYEETPSYQVETEYNIEKLPEDEIIEPTFMPTLDRPAPVSDASQDVKIRLNARGKILVGVFSMVVGILIAFMIYNAVVISNLSNQLAYLEVERTSISANVGELSSSYQDRTSYSSVEQNAIDLGMKVAGGTSEVVSISPRPEIKEATVDGNWFDSVCEFFSNLFS